MNTELKYREFPYCIKVMTVSTNNVGEFIGWMTTNCGALSVDWEYATAGEDLFIFVKHEKAAILLSLTWV